MGRKGSKKPSPLPASPTSRAKPSPGSALPVVPLEVVRLDDFDLAAYNPREIALDELSALRTSVEKFGLVQPIVVNRRSRRVVGGHQRVRVLRAAGQTEALAAVVDLDEPLERALNVALNSEELQGEFTEEASALARAIAGNAPELGDALRLRELADDVDAFARQRREEEEPPSRKHGQGGEGASEPRMAECPKCGHEFPRPKKGS